MYEAQEAERASSIKVASYAVDMKTGWLLGVDSLMYAYSYIQVCVGHHPGPLIPEWSSSKQSNYFLHY